MRIGMPLALAARTTCSTLSGPPMFPGLMRTAATPCSIAFSARLALKWMSAMIGTGEKRTICANASASSVFGTATRTISQPALASAAICAVVAATSCVFVVVIDWTTGGAPPPIFTPPTVTERSLAMGSGYRRRRARSHDPIRAASSRSVDSPSRSTSRIATSSTVPPAATRRTASVKSSTSATRSFRR